jgi:hypothetical protein
MSLNRGIPAKSAEANMKRLHPFLAGFSALLLILCCVSCASRPDEALKQAQAAMEEARQEEAADFAPGDWKSAQKAWDDAQTALTRGRYSEAAALLTTSRSRFEKARTISKAKRDDVRKEVLLVQNTVNTRFSVLKQNISTTRLSGKAQKDLAQCCQEVESSIDKLNSEVLNDHLIQARTLGQAALGKLNEAETKLHSLTKS